MNNIVQTLLWRRVSPLRIAEEVRYRAAHLGRPVYLLVGPTSAEVVDTEALTPEQHERCVGRFTEACTVEQILANVVKAMAEEVA